MDKKQKPEGLSERDWIALRPLLQRMEPPYYVRGYEGREVRKRGEPVSELRKFKYHRDAILSIVPNDNVPIIKAFLAGYKARLTYTAAADATFMVGRYFDAIKYGDDAGSYYDLLAITSAWVNRVDRLKFEKLLKTELHSLILERNRFGMGCIEKLVKHGLIRLGRNRRGTPGALKGVELAAFASEAVAAAFSDNVLNHLLEDAVPLLGRANTVMRARKMVTQFHDLAVPYYSRKAEVTP